MTELHLFFFRPIRPPSWASLVREEGETSFLYRGELPKVKPELERLARESSFWGVLFREEDRAIVVAHEGIVTFIESDENFEFGELKKSHLDALSVLSDMVSDVSS